MKKILFLIFIILVLTVSSFCQNPPLNTITYFSKGVSEHITQDGIQIGEDKIEVKDRIIIIGDKLIAITNFIEGTKTQSLIVIEITNNNNLGKIYRCKTMNKDFINGYQDAVVYIKNNLIVLAIFADNKFIYQYNYLIDKKVIN